MTLTVGTLRPTEHSGRQASVIGRVGRLLWSTVPGYLRIEVWCWYLLVPSRLAKFTEDAVSLQWAGHESVILLDGAAA